jgi:multiple sugar transport system substrate-binding protein
MNIKPTFASGAVALALLLSACNPAQPTPAAQQPAAEKATEAPVAPASTEKITLKLWGHQSDSFNKVTTTLIKDFQTANPNIEVKYETFPWEVFIQTMQTSIPAGNAADVIIMPAGYACRFGPGGQLVELPKTTMSAGEAQETYFAGPLGAYLCEGKLYGLPLEYNLEYGGAYVNKTLFEKAKVAYPPTWTSWDEVIDVAKKLPESDGKAMTKAGLHYTNNDQIFTYYLSGILQQGANYFADDGKHFKFDSPESIRTIELLVKMSKEDKVVDPVTFNADNNWVGESFATGNVGVAVLGSWYGGDIKISHPEVKYDYVALPPMFGNKHKFTSIGGWGVVVSKNTKNADAALTLMKFIAGTEANALTFNSETGTIPAMKSIVAAPDKLLEKAGFLKPVLPLLGDGQFVGNVTNPDKLAYEIIYPTILDAMQGNIAPAAAAAKIQQEANAMVDEAKK